MFYVLSKILGLLVNPLFYILILLILSFFVKKRQQKRTFALLSLISFVFFTNTAIVNPFVKKWENFKHTHYKNVQQYDYGVVLGGMIYFNSQNKHFEFRRSGNRIWKTLQLYEQKKIKKILISGGRASFFEPDEIESILLKKYLISIGISADDIITEEKSKNTYENAIFTKKILKPTDTVLLITSATHMRRSYKCFEKAGINCDTFSTDFYVKGSTCNIEDILFPSPQTLVKWNLIFHEAVGVIIYKLVGYI